MIQIFGFPKWWPPNRIGAPSIAPGMEFSRVVTKEEMCEEKVHISSDPDEKYDDPQFVFKLRPGIKRTFTNRNYKPSY